MITYVIGWIIIITNKRRLGFKAHKNKRKNKKKYHISEAKNFEVHIFLMENKVLLHFHWHWFFINTWLYYVLFMT